MAALGPGRVGGLDGQGAPSGDLCQVILYAVPVSTARWLGHCFNQTSWLLKQSCTYTWHWIPEEVSQHFLFGGRALLLMLIVRASLHPEPVVNFMAAPRGPVE